MLKILYWIVSLGLIAFEIAAGIGKQVGANMAVEWMWLFRSNGASDFGVIVPL
jgi:hypothetical protein